MDKENSSLNILLIEDSDTDAFSIQRTIKKYYGGVNCRRASTMHEGEDILQEEPVDLLLLDLGLPDTASPQHTYERAKKWFKKIPVIIMTNLCDHDFARVMVHEGAADFISKDILVKDPKHIQTDLPPEI